MTNRFYVFMNIAILFASENASKIEMTVTIVEVGFSIFMKALIIFKGPSQLQKHFQLFMPHFLVFFGVSHNSQVTFTSHTKVFKSNKEICFKFRYTHIAQRSKTCVIEKGRRAQEFEFRQKYLKNFQFKTSTGHIRQPNSILDYCQPGTFSF